MFNCLLYTSLFFILMFVLEEVMTTYGDSDKICSSFGHEIMFG